jgi:tetratricopeptide (TPR) repeat protein
LGLTYHASGRTDRALEHVIEAVKSIDLGLATESQTSDLAGAYQALIDRYVAKGDSENAKKYTEALLGFFSSQDWQKKASEARLGLDVFVEDGAPMTLAEYLETPETAVIVSTMRRTSEYLRRNMLMTAAEECFFAIGEAPFCLPLHARLAEILLMLDRSEQAVAKFLTIADVYRMRGDTKNATGIYKKILGLAPMDVRARRKLAGLLIEQGEIDQALEHYLLLADTHYQLAQVSLALERYGEALSLVSGSSDQKKWETKILHRMGDIFRQRVDWARATAAYESLVTIAPDDEAALLALVDLYFKQGHRDKGLQAFEALWDLYEKSGDTQKLLNITQDAARSCPNESRLLVRLADLYANLGMADQAVTAYDAAGKMQLKAGLREEAVRSIESIIELGPDNVDEYRRLLSRVQGSSG